MNDTIATPAASSTTNDLQLRMTLEPVRNLKIDLNASRTKTVQKSMQYMYEGTPTTESGTFTMTTISIGSAFEGMGSASSGYKSKTFESLSTRSSLTATRWRRVMPTQSIRQGRLWLEASLMLRARLSTSTAAT